MKKSVRVVIAIVILYLAWALLNGTFDAPSPSTIDGDVLADAIRDHQSGVQVSGDGIVTRILEDDNDGSRHQRFVLTLSTGQTLLVAHNIDIAPRLEPLQRGDSVAFHGVYEWNALGGVIHWTHHDPDGRHESGWLRHDGRTYQ